MMSLSFNQEPKAKIYGKLNIIDEYQSNMKADMSIDEEEEQPFKGLSNFENTMATLSKSK